MPIVLVSFASLWQNTWDKLLITRKGLFWFTASEFSVHDYLACLLWACSGTVHHGRRTWQRWPVYLMVAQKQRMEVARVPISPPRTPHGDLTFSHKVQPPKGYTTSQQCHRLWTKTLTCVSMGTFQIQTIPPWVLYWCSACRVRKIVSQCSTSSEFSALDTLVYSLLPNLIFSI